MAWCGGLIPSNNVLADLVDRLCRRSDRWMIRALNAERELEQMAELRDFKVRKQIFICPVCHTNIYGVFLCRIDTEQVKVDRFPGGNEVDLSINFNPKQVGLILHHECSTEPSEEDMICGAAEKADSIDSLYCQYPFHKDTENHSWENFPGERITPRCEYKTQDRDYVPPLEKYCTQYAQHPVNQDSDSGHYLRDR